MSFRASLSVFLGFHFGQAKKLLNAANNGEEEQVKEVLSAQPQLAAFTGLHGTTSPLHRAAAAGHLFTCEAILDVIKRKAAAVDDAVATGRCRPAVARRWQALVRTVIDQRTNRGQTPLMLACQHGHADVVSFLLEEGADPLLADIFHGRTALHYAALGGHAACIRALCADSTTVLTEDGARRPLRDLVSHDIQVESAKYIDQRSFGGLTALHFAAVSGKLAAVQALLRAGASIMVKSDGEAFIGQDILIPGSSPLHIAAVVGSIPVAHALLQAHAELMSAAGGTRDERRRRPWEGHSRTDIRSVRNSARKLPYHLARDRGFSAMMHLVDPRISIDAALDAARDTDQGIGPKRLGTMCSLVLQQSLIQWLDECGSEIDGQKGQERPKKGNKKAHVKKELPEQTKETGGKSWSLAQFANAGSAVAVVPMNSEETTHWDSPFAPMHSAAAFDEPESPGARLASSPPATPRPRPTEEEGILHVVAKSAPAISQLGMQRAVSLHAYVAMLSVKRPLAKTRHESRHQRHATLGGFEFASPEVLQSSIGRLPRALSTGSLLQLNRISRSVSDETDGIINVTVVAASPQARTSPVATTQAAMRRALSTLCDRLRTPSDATCVAAAVNSVPAVGESGKCGVESEACTVCCSGSDSDIGGDVDEATDLECGVCLDRQVDVAFAGCDHALCLECARNLTKQDKKPPSCPFCRRMVVGFKKWNQCLDD